MSLFSHGTKKSKIELILSSKDKSCPPVSVFKSFLLIFAVSVFWFPANVFAVVHSGSNIAEKNDGDFLLSSELNTILKTISGIFFDDETGNVGIGVLDPKNELVIGESRMNNLGGEDPALEIGGDRAFITLGKNNQARVQLGWNNEDSNAAEYADLTTVGSSLQPLVLQRNGGNVGIGTTNPSAKLEVAGTIQATDFIRTDGSSLEKSDYFQVYIDDTSRDLGTQLAEMLEKYDRIYAVLARKSFTWNVPISVSDRQTLVIRGEGYQNGANNIGTTINMTTANERALNDSNTNPHRCVYRATSAGHLNIAGIYLQESINSSLPLHSSGVCRALFSTSEFGKVSFAQSYAWITEDLTNFNGWSVGHIRFGWTYVYRHPSYSKSGNLYVVKADSGWNFAGHGGTVSHSHTYLYDNIQYQNNSRIQYYP